MNAACAHAEPLYTLNSFAVVLKYKAPVISASPSLSVDVLEDLAPKYLSSKESNEFAAEVALEDAEVALLAAAVAEDAAAVAEVAAAAALVAAAVPLPKMLST